MASGPTASSPLPTEVQAVTAPRRGGKNIVVCSDGTGNRDIQGRGTNVFKLFEAVDLNGHRTDPMLAPQVALISHTDLLRHSARGHVAWEDQADQARDVQPFVRMTGDHCGGFGREPLAPQALVDHVGDVDFVEAVECPRQQSATTD